MTHTTIVVCGRIPDLIEVLRSALSTETELRLSGRPVGGSIQLATRTGRPVIRIEGPLLVDVSGEAERLLGPDYAGLPTPMWWVEIRCREWTDGDHGLRFARKLGRRLADNTGGMTWPG